MKKQIEKIKAETEKLSNVQILEIINRAPVKQRKGTGQKKLIEKSCAIAVAARRGILPERYWET